MPKVEGPGLPKNGKYHARQAGAKNLFYLEQIVSAPAKDDEDPDWSLRIDQPLARELRKRFSKTCSNFQQTVHVALQFSLEFDQFKRTRATSNGRSKIEPQAPRNKQIDPLGICTFSLRH